MTDLHDRLAAAKSAEQSCRADIAAAQANGEDVSPAYYSSAGILSQQVISLEIEIARRNA